MKENRLHLSRSKINEFLNKKDTDNLNQVTLLALSNAKLLHEILLGVKSKPEIYRYNCYEVILQICKEHPKLLYPHWNYFLNC